MNIKVEYEYGSTFTQCKKRAIGDFSFKIQGPIKGVNFSSIKNRKISCIAAFRQTEKVGGKKEVFFTKVPLKLEGDLSMFILYKLRYKSPNLNALKHGRKIELTGNKGNKKLIRRVTAGNSTINLLLMTVNLL